MNLLHFDVEGGWGGSSNSLFELVKRLKINGHKSYVICRKKGPIQQKYKKEKIKYFLEENLYSFIPRKNGKNLKNFIRSLTQIVFFPFGLFNVLRIIKKYKIEALHINYEGFFLLGLVLKILINKPILFHIRTQFPKNNLACRFIVKLIVNFIADYIFFISDREKFYFNKYDKNSKVPKQILFNISTFQKKNKKTKNNLITYFGNISYQKGVDRIIDVAILCKKLNLNYKFQIFGKLNKNGYGKDFYLKLKKKINDYNLKNIHLMGHVSKPEKYLCQSYLQIRISRTNDPYGRDIIEALTMSVPSLATGFYQGIIKHNINGYLIGEYSLSKTIYYLKKIYKNKKREKD